MPQWQREIKNADYGYIKRTEAADSGPGKKRGLDVFVKPGTPAEHAGPVYVIDQLEQATDAFDETKTMLGYASKAEALKAYRANYPKGWKTGTVTEAPLAVFEQWAKSAQSTKPFAERTELALEKVVTLKVQEAETGRPAEVDMPAHEALAHLDHSIQRAKDLLACLST